MISNHEMNEELISHTVLLQAYKCALFQSDTESKQTKNFISLFCFGTVFVERWAGFRALHIYSEQPLSGGNATDKDFTGVLSSQQGVKQYLPLLSTD